MPFSLLHSLTTIQADVILLSLKSTEKVTSDRGVGFFGVNVIFSTIGSAASLLISVTYGFSMTFLVEKIA